MTKVIKIVILIVDLSSIELHKNHKEMIYLTFTHSRDIFKKNEFQNWIKIWLKSARFEGCEYGNHYPIIKVEFTEFVTWKKHQLECEKQKSRLVKIEGIFTFLEQLSFGFRNFENTL